MIVSEEEVEHTTYRYSVLNDDIVFINSGIKKIEKYFKQQRKYEVIK